MTHLGTGSDADIVDRSLQILVSGMFSRVLRGFVERHPRRAPVYLSLGLGQRDGV